LNRKIRAPFAIALHHQSTVLGNHRLRVRLDERVAWTDLDRVVRLAAAGAALLAVETGGPRRARGPRRVDARITVAAAAIHGFAAAS
jgi:hypothetical protein